MKPPCARCNYLASVGSPTTGCVVCPGSLVREVAFSRAYRGVPVDQAAALAIGVAALAIACFADHRPAVLCTAVAVLIAGLYSMFSRQATPQRARRVRRAKRPGAAAAAAASPIAPQRPPRTHVRR